MSPPAKQNHCLEHYESENGGQGGSCLFAGDFVGFYHPELLRGLVGETLMATAAIIANAG